MTVERTVKLISTTLFDISQIFDGGTIEEVQEKLRQSYQNVAKDNDLVTFGYDHGTHDVYVKLWRPETDLELERRTTRIQNLELAREIKKKNATM